MDTKIIIVQTVQWTVSFTEISSTQKEYNPTLGGGRETVVAWMKVGPVIFRWWVQSPSDKSPLLVSVLLRLSERMGGDGRTSSHSSSWVSRSLDCLHWVTAAWRHRLQFFHSYLIDTLHYTSKKSLQGERVWFKYSCFFIVCLNPFSGIQVLFQ